MRSFFQNECTGKVLLDVFHLWSAAVSLKYTQAIAAYKGSRAASTNGTEGTNKKQLQIIVRDGQTYRLEWRSLDQGDSCSKQC